MSAPRVIVGVSGGEDSSVAALRLVQQGEAVAGLFMQNWADDGTGECRAEDDRRDAVAVCGRLGIPVHFRDFSAEYWQGVFEHFLAEYAAGRTPNPDVLCNREVKFKHFLDAARELGAEKIATGHYARVGETGGRWRLLRGMDRGKDQSYFLHQLGQAQLSATLFPIGELQKPDLRRIAREAGLPTHDKKDSTGICFIGERPFREFLGRYLQHKPGPIKLDNGQTVGEHVGLSFYTLGQRKGIGIGGLKSHKNADGTSEPWFVARKDIATNTLYIVQGHDHPWLLSEKLGAGQASWIAGEPPGVADTSRALSAKTRYRQADVPCTVTPEGLDRFTLDFTDPQWAVTPGQSAVLYDGDVCLGGGIIDTASAV